jgi:hypothetical protein
MNVPDPTTRPWSWLAALVVLLTVAIEPHLEAQVLYGSIVGTVRDSTGGVLPGATVAITQQETAPAHTASPTCRPAPTRSSCE